MNEKYAEEAGKWILDRSRVVIDTEKGSFHFDVVDEPPVFYDYWKRLGVIGDYLADDDGTDGILKDLEFLTRKKFLLSDHELTIHNDLKQEFRDLIKDVRDGKTYQPQPCHSQPA